MATAAWGQRKSQDEVSRDSDNTNRPAGWPGRHAAEIQAQKKKAKQRETEAGREGRLGTTPDLAETVEKGVLAGLLVDRNIANAAKRQEVAAGIMRRTLSWDCLIGRTVNCDADPHGGKGPVSR